MAKQTIDSWGDRISYQFFNILFWIICHIPPCIHQSVATFLLIVFKPVLKKEYAKIALNVHKIKGLPPHSYFAQQFGRQVLRHQIIIGLETFWTHAHPRAVTFLGMEELTRIINDARAGGKGFIAITGHIGSWELLAYACGLAIGEPMAALAKPSKVKAVTKLLDRNRHQLMMRPIWTDRKTLLREMLETLHANQGLGFAMDQRPDSRRGIMVNFLGHEAAFVVGPGKTAMSSGAVIMGLYAVRVGPMTYRLVSRKLWEPQTGAHDEAVITQLMADDIANIIEQYPEQWVWNYKRWYF